jgi:dTMP kinase
MIKHDRGFFVTLEGIDGCGKSTQFKKLQKFFKPWGAVFVQDPGSTALGEQLRGMVLKKSVSISPITELLLYNAARRQLFDEVIQPALEAGKIVIADRYFDSTVAYQGYAKKLPHAFIHQLIGMTTDGIAPHKTIFIDVPIESAMARIAERTGKQDDYDKASISFWRDVYEGYHKIALDDTDRVSVVRGDRAQKTVYNNIMKILMPLLEVNGFTTRLH